MKCPILNSERRLQDAVSYWQSARESYFDIDEFRRNVQSSIQAFRSVTWLLQKAKDFIPNFQDWYQVKQCEMREDDRLRWLIGARNKIEKQGDLDTHSKFIIEHTDSWLPAEKRTFELPPSTRPKDTARIIAATYPESKCLEGSVLKVSREWVDSGMPDEEVLTLLVHAYSRLQEVILGAHELLPAESRESCDFFRVRTSTNAHLPEEMTEFQFPVVAWFSLEQGVLKEYEEKKLTLTREDIEKTVKERYDKFGGMDIHLSPKSSFSEICVTFFELGKRMLMKDGYHSMIAMIFNEKGFFPIEFRPDDRADKHVMIRELASQCARLRAVSCILINEAWFAPLSAEHGPYAVDHPDRQEALLLVAFHKDEGFITKEALFQREGDKIVFLEGMEMEGKHPWILNPVAEAIRKVWGQC